MQRFIKGIAKFALCLTIVFMTLSIGLATKSPSNYVYAAEGDVTVDATNFPDANFRQWVLDNITNGSTTLTAAKISNTRSIDVSNKSIANLKGIEYFTALVSLNCSTNQLTALDVSKNMALVSLVCDSNQLTALDVSKNTALLHFRCPGNQLKTLDVSKRTLLEELYCYNNQLTELDVSKNTALRSLYCNENKLTALDVSNNTALVLLYCNDNQLTTLDISKNTSLSAFKCSNNKLTTLDVSSNTLLVGLYCEKNQLTTLDVGKSTALRALQCHSNQLTALDVTKNTALETLTCYTNQLTALDLSQNKQYINTSLNGEVGQAPVYKAKQVGNKYVVDLKQNDTKLNTAKIVNLVSNGTYDPAAATVTYDSKPAATEKISYAYDSDSLNQGTEDMIVEGTVVVEVTPIPNTADNNLIWFYTLLFVVSLIGVSGIVAYTKRKI